MKTTIAAALALVVASGAAMAEFKDFTVNGDLVTKGQQEAVATEAISNNPNPHAAIANPQIEDQVRQMVTGITTDGNITMLRKGITGISLLNSIAVTSSGSVWISANIEMSSLSVFNKISSFLFLFIIYSSCVKLSPMPKTGTKLIIPCRIRKIHGN